MTEPLLPAALERPAPIRVQIKVEAWILALGVAPKVS